MKIITKTILNLIITTFGVLFILSACGGGAVTIGLEEQTCTNNLFSPDCGDSGQADRTKAITECAESDKCDDVPPDVQTCLTDLFSSQCEGAVANTIATRTDVTIETLRKTFCETNGADDNCQTTPSVMETCTSNPFDSDCGAIYNTNRETSCRANNTPACADTITRYCVTEAVGTPANVFDTLCATYDTARETACRTGNHDSLCASTITRFCETEATPANGNTLNPLCAAVKYNTPREAACQMAAHAALCTPTITRFCETDATPANGNTLNPLCAAVKYNTPREVACRTGNHANLCGDTIMRFCTTAPTLDTYFDPLCVADTTAIMERNMHCGMGAENGAMATAFTDMRCADDTKGLEVRNTHCVMGGIEAGGNAFTPDCALNPAAQALLLTASACMDAMDACLPALRKICEAEVASFNTLCGSARTTRCVAGALLHTESLCNGSTYEMGRETACVDGVSGIDTECNTLYTRYCGAGAENPFDTMAGETDTINCLDQTSFAPVRQTLCGNSRPDAGSKFETECNSLIVNLCTAKPYDIEVGAANYNCFMDDAFIMARSEERKTCRVGTAADGPDCADLVARDSCITDPFREGCNPVEYMAERTAREVYCLSGVDGDLPVPIQLCGTFRIPYCVVGANGETAPEFEPTRLVCPTANRSGQILLAYCSVGNRWNDPAIRQRCGLINSQSGGCVANPFLLMQNGRNLCRTGTARWGQAAMANRAKFCSDDVDLDDPAQLALCVVSGKTDAEKVICASSGVFANPFTNLCVRDGTDNDMKRADFLTSCGTSDTFAPACAPVLACVGDPYGADCVDNRAYSSYRQTIVDECDMLDGTFTATCTQPIKESIQACLTAPYSMACKDNPDYDNRRTARLGECQGLTGSDAIRTAGGDNEAKCRPAFDVFCTGDNLFTDMGANCLGDNNYKTARDLHFAECKKATSARVGTDCTIASAQICQSAETEYTDPFVPLCVEASGNSLLVRQELIKRCVGTAENDREESCDTGGAFDILNDCGDDPVIGKCADYIGTESAKGAYFDARASRLSACAAEEGPTNHQNTCTGAIEVLCTSINADSAPFGPVCNNVFNIHVVRNGFFAACNTNASPADCNNPLSMTVKTACEADPYNSAVPTIGAATLDCNDFSFYITPRETRLTDCENGNSNVCGGVIGIVCRVDGANANPFSNLCDDSTYATEQRDFCQIRANVGNAGCTSGDLTRPTTASVLAAQTTELGAIPTVDGENEFLKGTDTGLNTDGYLQFDATEAEVVTINMETAEYDGVPFGGDAADGIAFFAGRPATGTGSSARVEYYAGILAGADLGAPLRQETNATVNWYGAVNWAVFYRGVSNNSLEFAYQSGNRTDTTTRDFVLEINLGLRTFRSFFGQAAGDNTPIGQKVFILTGGYHATTGVITNGAVAFGERANANSIRTISASTENEGPYNGPLIGIIGAQGALGVFHAQRHNGTQGISLSGGFVARAPRGDFISWSRAADALASAGAGDGMASFIRGGTEELDVGAGGVTYTLTLADNYSKADSQEARFGGDIVTLGGQAVDGVSFAVNGDRLYSGLLADTNVGVPLTANANYQGRIGILIHKDGETIYDVDNEFTLNANFGPGTFNDGFANLGGLAFTISGGKFNQFGLIRGTVNLGASSGTLSGLIGTEGVVGAFISTVHTDGAFAGGFVARANTAITSGAPRDRTRPVWRVNAVTDNGTSLNVLSGGGAVGSGNSLTNFIVGGGTALGLPSAQNIKQDALKANDGYTDSRGDTINLDGESADGVAFARATILSANKWYAGLLAGTALGNPVSHTATTADWVGQVGLVKDGINSGNPYTTDLVLTVNFKDRKISSRAIAIFADTLTIDGRYDGHGLIRGTVSYATPTQTSVGHLTGLIGAGISAGGATAVGAFVSGASGNDVGGYAGGFVVRESAGVDIITRKVVYGDWAYSFDTPLPNQLDASAPHNQFLGTVAGDTLLDDDGFLNTTTAREPKALTLSDSFDAITFAGDPEDGVSFFWDNWGESGYAGILADTDLGAPLMQASGTAEWKGIFQAFVGSFASVMDIKRNFVLEINFDNNGKKTIEAFVQQAGEFHYHLTGSFDENGVITGEVDFGEFNDGTRVQKAARADSNGFLTGLIGEQGAVGAFLSGTGTKESITNSNSIVYSGGFVASSNVVNHVRYIDWTGSFTTTLTDTMLNPTDRVSQFLATASAATALDEMGAGTINAVNKGSLNLNTATFKGAALNGQAADGVSWFWDSTDNFGYAGILAGTDLGAPLTQTSGTAKWNGSFQTTGDVTINDNLAITYSVHGGRAKVNTNIKRDFLLEIDFDNDKIEAFIYHFGTSYYHLTGNFGASGVITGEVNYGTFTDLAARTATDGETIGTPRAPNGILTGLIGAQGAVGAFISGTGDKNAIATVDPVFYAGGFVATPTNALDDDTVNSDNVVNYDDWLRGFITLPPDRLDISSESRRGQFLAWNSGRNDLDRTGSRRELSNDRAVLTLATTFSEIGGQAADGVSFFYDSWGAAGYAGIRSSTNLGAPLTQTSGTANWNGHIRSVGTYINREFVLEINFADSNKIEAFVQTAGEYHFHLTGNFTASGVITGKVNYGRFTAGTRTPTDSRTDNGFLTGLIGMEGAVGAFVSGTGTKDAIVRLGSGNYSGGFVAHKEATSIGVNVKFNDWTRSFNTFPDAAPNPTLRNQFLRGTADNLTVTPTVPESGIVTELGENNDGTGTITPTLLTLGTTLSVSGDTKNGVGFFRGFDSAGADYFYAGIFNGTDLGAPLTSDTASGVWKGKFQVVGDNAVNEDFTLEVTFGAVTGFSELTGTVAAFVNQSGDNYYHLTGTYDRNGVISGKVDFGGFNTGTRVKASENDRVEATVRGLIGSGGAIGVFVNDATTLDGYAGGFVACKRNPADTACK